MYFADGHCCRHPRQLQVSEKHFFEAIKGALKGGVREHRFSAQGSWLKEQWKLIWRNDVRIHIFDDESFNTMSPIFLYFFRQGDSFSKDTACCEFLNFLVLWLKAEDSCSRINAVSRFSKLAPIPWLPYLGAILQKKPLFLFENNW